MALLLGIFGRRGPPWGVGFGQTIENRHSKGVIELDNPLRGLGMRYFWEPMMPGCEPDPIERYDDGMRKSRR
jgi:hypothetical protein